MINTAIIAGDTCGRFESHWYIEPILLAFFLYSSLSDYALSLPGMRSGSRCMINFIRCGKLYIRASIYKHSFVLALLSLCPHEAVMPHSIYCAGLEKIHLLTLLQLSWRSSFSTNIIIHKTRLDLCPSALLTPCSEHHVYIAELLQLCRCDDIQRVTTPILLRVA